MNIFVIDPMRNRVALRIPASCPAVDPAIADRPRVNGLSVFCDDNAAHRLVLFGEAVKELVELGFVGGLRVCVTGGYGQYESEEYRDLHSEVSVMVESSNVTPCEKYFAA